MNMRMNLKKLALLLTILFSSNFFITTASALTTEKINVDQVLLNAGFEEQILELLSPEDKEIHASVINDGGEYHGTTSSHYKFDENENIIEVKSDERAMISPSDLDFYISSTSLNGKYYITGTYEWLASKFKSIKNHVFTMSLPSGWEIDATTIRYNTWYKDMVNVWTLMDNIQGSAYDIGDRSITWSSLSYDSIIPLIYDKKFKGNCTIQTKRVGSTKEIKLQYGYSSGGDGISVVKGSYGVTYNSPSVVNQLTEVHKF